MALVALPLQNLAAMRGEASLTRVRETQKRRRGLPRLIGLWPHSARTSCQCLDHCADLTKPALTGQPLRQLYYVWTKAQKRHGGQRLASGATPASVLPFQRNP